jgi:hypothetical protein
VRTTPKQEQPTLFPLRDDCRPTGERSAAERYRKPSLFSGAGRAEVLALGHACRSW